MTAASRPGGLAVFTDPEAVTVVGASDDTSKWGSWLARGALRGAHRRAVHLVNRRGGPVAGHPTVCSLADVAGPLGLVALCVPPAALPEVVHQALDLGATGLLGITAGLDAALGPGAERALAADVRRSGARLVGPNCLGLYDAATDLQLAWGEFTPGRLAVVSQSGQVGSELADLAAESGLGVSRFVSVGSQADVTAAEVLGDLVDHDQTAVVAVYLESFGDGVELVETLRRLRASGKPTLLLTVGESEAGRRAAVSHTGALTSRTALVDAACRAAGAVRVETPAQLVAAARTLAATSLPPGPRVAVVADSGGQGGLAADVLSRRGVQVAPFGDSCRRTLVGLLPAHAGVGNPVDLAGAGEADLGVYADVVGALLADDGVDAVAMTGYFGSYGRLTPSLRDPEAAVAARIALASAKSGKPVVVHSMSRASETLDRLDADGVATHHTIDDAAAGLAAAVHLTTYPGRALPAARADTTCPVAGYLDARRVLEPAGVRFPRAVPVRSATDLDDAVRRLRPPFVLKADWVAHKTEVGAVAVGLRDRNAAHHSLKDMTSRLGPGTFVLEEMDVRVDVVEMIVGARRDPVFGPTVVVGTGGVQAEMFRDTALELGPVDLGTAHDMLGRLRGRALLAGWRGRPAVDVDALAALVVLVSGLLAEGWTDLELNPVRVGADGVLAVDALIHTTTAQEQT